MAFFLLLPKFKCEERVKNGWFTLIEGSDDYEQKCKPAYFCGNPQMRYEQVPADITLNNWMTNWRLECASPAYIAFFGQSFFVGLVIGAFFTT